MPYSVTELCANAGAHANGAITEIASRTFLISSPLGSRQIFCERADWWPELPPLVNLTIYFVFRIDIDIGRLDSVTTIPMHDFGDPSGSTNEAVQHHPGFSLSARNIKVDIN
jgi:hypothetical protein